ncbi:MAG: response regulator [Candidatus Omnitrophica bacterium]|nr:response regulator [Candidatus Omnitrophota bacterium]
MTNSNKSRFDYPLKVLVVEDNEVDKKVIESMLNDPTSSISYIKLTNTLNSALKILKESKFDAVVLDLNLPDSKGVGTLEKLNKRFPEIAIIVNTGAYEDELGLQTLTLGAQDFLVKGRYTSYVLNKVLHYCLERKRAEVELKRAYAQLKETQGQLVQAEKMKVVGGLASGIAHEVKNPLSTILYGVTYLIQQLKSPSRDVETVLTNIKEATNKANNIITGLLDFASLSKVDREKADLNHVIERALALASHLISKNKINVVKKYQTTLPKINIDVNRIEQVLINLILNSVYAMPKGGKIVLISKSEILNENMPEIPLEDRDKFEPGDEVAVISIEDSGCGLSQEVSKQLFDPFFTTRRAKGGTGLGLSVSKNIMAIHEGSISVKNKKTGGAIAKIILKI